MKKTILAVLILCLMFSSQNYATANNGQEIRIILDGKLLVQDVPATMINNRVLLPFRAIFHELGAEVRWDESTRTAIGLKDGVKIELPLDQKAARVGGKQVALDVPATIINGRTLVPLRFVAETLGADVNWIGEQRLVIITTKGDKISQTDLLDILLKGDFSNDSLGVKLDIGMSEKDLITLIGEPNRKDLSEKGFYWYIYNTDYKNYIQVGVVQASGKVVAFGTSAGNWRMWDTIKVGATTNIVNRKLNEIDTNISISELISRNRRTIDGHMIEIYLDQHQENRVISFMLYDQNHYYATSQYNETILRGMELRLLDLVNATRATFDLNQLDWCEKAASAARKHSEDMAANRYFAHMSLDGRSPWDRMVEEGITASSAAENLAMGYAGAMDAHIALMNSAGHRANILSLQERLGVGIVFNGSLYFTQKFYSPR